MTFKQELKKSEYLSYSELTEGDESSLSLAERLSKFPHLRHRMESILGIIENADGSCQTADEAERRAIEKVRKSGQEVLQGVWPSVRYKRSVTIQVSSENPYLSTGFAWHRVRKGLYALESSKVYSFPFIDSPPRGSSRSQSTL